MTADSHIDPVSGNDAAWLRLDRSTNHMVITAMAVIEPLTFRRFTDLIEQRFLCFDRFRCKPVSYSGIYFWEAGEQEIQDHVHEVTLPQPAGRAELENYLSDLQSQPLPPDRPLWEFVLIKGYRGLDDSDPQYGKRRPPGRSVAIMRIHHCYADGLALIAVFATLTDAVPIKPARRRSRREKEEPEELATERRFSLKAGIDAVTQRMERMTQFSFRLNEERHRWLKTDSSKASALQFGLNSAAELARFAALPRDPQTVIRGKLGVRKQATWSHKLPLDDFKAVASRFEASVNDVLLSCVSGGLGAFLAERQAVKTALELHAAVPVNLRAVPLPGQTSGLDEPAAGDREELLGNEFGTVFIPLGVGLTNRVERLYKTKHDMRALRGSVQPMLSHLLIGTTGLLPSAVQQKVMDSFTNKTSLVLSNVPGSAEQRFIAGSAVHELMFWVPQGGETGLGISLLSYHGSVQIGILSDPGCVDQPQALLDAICGELQQYMLTKTSGHSA